jgi:hypothetical protein
VGKIRQPLIKEAAHSKGEISKQQKKPKKYYVKIQTVGGYSRMGGQESLLRSWC